MGVIAETCDRVAVMYAGRIAEIGPVHEVINHPAHPYSDGLMAAIPDITVDREMLNQIDGAMPRLNAIPKGCAFNPRCPQVMDRCRSQRPELYDAGATRAACWGACRWMSARSMSQAWTSRLETWSNCSDRTACWTMRRRRRTRSATSCSPPSPPGCRAATSVSACPHQGFCDSRAVIPGLSAAV
jgi:oligopeptide/dipeptide ABC transporter ATP-binding protein